MDSLRMEHLESLSRGELQALAKAHGIKANQASAVIIVELANALREDEPCCIDVHAVERYSYITASTQNKTKAHKWVPEQAGSKAHQS